MKDLGAPGAAALPHLGYDAAPMWAWVAILGTAAVLVWRGVESFPLAQGQMWTLYVLLPALVLVSLAIRFLMPEACRTLRKHWALCIPLGIRTVVNAVLFWFVTLSLWRGVLTGVEHFELLRLAFDLSISIVLFALVDVCYAAWTTLLILRAVREDRCDPADAFGRSWRVFLRALAVLFCGHGVLLLGLVPSLFLVGEISIFIIMAMMAVWALAWNFVTAAMLPVVLESKAPLLDAVKDGFRQSWEKKGRWAVPLVAQLLLMGLFVYFDATYKEVTETSAAGEFSRGTRTRSKTNKSVHAFWVGSYEDTCKWEDKLMEFVRAPTAQLFGLLLALLYGVLAVSMKLTVVHRL